MKNSKHNDFDVVISVAAKDNLIIRTTIKQICENINPSKIYILTKPEYRIFYADIRKKYNVIVLDEDLAIPNLSYSKLDKIIKNKQGKTLRTGWYFQQFLKMGFAMSQYADKFYLIWDADTIPVSNLSFFNGPNPLFTEDLLPEGLHIPYFNTLDKLLPSMTYESYSFIVENMMVDTKIMKHLIKEISNAKIQGNLWYEKIINAIDPDDDIAFSEFETYGTFANNRYPNYYKIRKIKKWKLGGSQYGRIVSKKDINEMKKKWDTVSLEPAHKPKFFRYSYQFVIKVILYTVNYLLEKVYLIKSKKINHSITK
jgi:hypothetical protein